jgi:hypothetical protein
MPLEPLLVGFAGSLINCINGMQGAICPVGRSIQDKKDSAFRALIPASKIALPATRTASRVG